MRNLSSYRPVVRTVAIHLVFSIAVMYSLHLGYKQLNGFILDKPPAYQYQEVFFFSLFGRLL